MADESQEGERGRYSYKTNETGTRISAHEGDREVGQVQISYTKSGRAVIVDIGVDKGHQGHGIGTQLTQQAEHAAIDHGASQIGAIAQPDYLKTLEKEGYKTDGFFATKDLPKSK